MAMVLLDWGRHVNLRTLHYNCIRLKMLSSHEAAAAEMHVLQVSQLWHCGMCSAGPMKSHMTKRKGLVTAMSYRAKPLKQM